jgi:glycosyltransferase involved in cell wall biosynthesis
MGGFESVSIIISTLDETELLKKTLRIICDVCRHEDIREIIIVISDKSTPENLETVESLQDSVPDIPVVVYKQKLPGVGMAFREAIQTARGSHIITMVSDCEMDVAAVSVMTEQAKLRPDAIITTSRYIEGGGFEDYNGIKKICNFAFQKMLRTVFKTRLTDITNCYQISPAPFMKSIRFEETRKPFFLESVLKPLMLGAEFVEIPCVWQKRADGKDKVSFFACFEYFRTVFRVRFKSGKEMTGNGKLS